MFIEKTKRINLIFAVETLMLAESFQEYWPIMNHIKGSKFSLVLSYNILLPASCDSTLLKLTIDATLLQVKETFLHFLCKKN